MKEPPAIKITDKCRLRGRQIALRGEEDEIVSSYVSSQKWIPYGKQHILSSINFLVLKYQLGKLTL